MRRTSFAEMACSMARSLEVMGEWWTPLIIRDVYLGLRRFDDLATNLGISRNLLATRLRQLEEDGLIERRRYRDRPPRDEYLLSRAGRELVPVLLALIAWGDRWVATDAGPPMRFRHRLCGETFEPQVTCSACGAPVEADDVVPLPGPGGREGPGTRLFERFAEAHSRREQS